MCIYCRIVAGEVPASVVYEDDHAIAFLDIQPITPGHILVIPKSHTESLIDLSREDAGHMIRVGQMIDKALRQSDLLCEGVNLFLADGKAAGQDVGHVHLHVFPRYEGDGFKIGFNGALNKPPSRKQLDENAKKIIRAVKYLLP